MKQYEGICRGGPIDGKQLAHTSKIFTVVVPVQTKDPHTFDTQHYEYKFILGQWVWQRKS